MDKTLVYNIHLYVELNRYEVSIQCPNFLISSISQVTVHIFSWWSWSWHQELTLLGRWFSRCSPWPQETRSGSRAAWTIVSPPCSGVFITNLEHIENYSYFQLQGFPFEINRMRTLTHDLLLLMNLELKSDIMIYSSKLCSLNLLCSKVEYLHPPDIDIEISKDNSRM